MNTPIKLDISRTRALLAYASEQHEEFGAYKHAEVQALAQRVIDLEACLQLLEPLMEKTEP